MPALIVIGGGIAGLSTAMLLARDGHHVTVLERHLAPPASLLRLPHLFTARFRELLDVELPDVAAELEAAGALRFNCVLDMPVSITGGRRRGDERFEQLTGRRPLVEAAIARVAAREPGVEIRRGVAVKGLAVEAASGRPAHVTAVVTEAGEVLVSDLVVDAAAGAAVPVEERADSGYVCYGRHYRSADGTMPPMLAPPLQHHESMSLLTLPGDNGHWSVAITAIAEDPVLRQARHVDVWERIVGSCPLAANWIDAEAVTGIDVMAGIDDRVRQFDPVTAPTGVVAVGDSAACTNPSTGRGATLALLHAVCLRDVIRDAGTGDAIELARRWREASAERVEPYVTDTVTFERHRRAQIEAEIAGSEYVTPDPAWNLDQALMAAAPHDPDVLRGAMSVAGMLARGVDVISQPGMMEAIARIGPVPPRAGPSRAQLVQIVEQSSRKVA